MGALSPDASANTWLLKWKPLLESCSYIGVRGPSSVQSLASIGIQAELLGDPACLLARDPGFWAPVPKALGVNIGAIKDEAALDTLNRFVAAKIKEGWQPTFFVVSPEDIDLVHQSLQRLGTPQATCHFIYRNAEAYLTAVRSMTGFVGIRLHSVILALCAGVPSIMLAYAPKCHDFMTSVEMQDFAIDLKELNEDRLTTRFEQLLSGQQEIGYTITRQMTRFRNRQQAKATEIRTQIFDR